MANIYDSYISCTTNPELLRLLDPERIISNKARSRFLRNNFDEIVYEGRGITMHDDIITLSLQFPNEVFMVRYNDVCAHFPVPRECVRYSNGEQKFMGYEPVYKFSDPYHFYDAMGEDTLLKLWFRVREYLFRLDHTKESLIEDEKYYVDMLEDHYDNSISSTVTINAEVDNFKLSVDKITNAELIFRGYTRGSKNEEWVEILPGSKGQVPEK